MANRQSAAYGTSHHYCNFVRNGVEHEGGALRPHEERKVQINHKYATIYGDEAECTKIGSPPPLDRVVRGSLSVFIHGQPAARLTDKTFGGMVAGGSGNVFYNQKQAKFLNEAAASWIFSIVARLDLPFKVPWEGCWARAHEMRRVVLEQTGVDLEKMFIFAKDDTRLAPLLGKVQSPEPTLPDTVTWGYHVAPTMRGVYQGQPVYWIFDPSLSPHSVATNEEWYRLADRTGNLNTSRTTTKPGRTLKPDGKDGWETDDDYKKTKDELALERDWGKKGNLVETEADVSKIVAPKMRFTAPVLVPHVP